MNEAEWFARTADQRRSLADAQLRSQRAVSYASIPDPAQWGRTIITIL
jgi:hypothetical protein